MAPRLFIADPNDQNWPLAPTESALELNSFESGDQFGFGLVDDIDFGVVEVEETILSQPPFPGGIQTIRRHETAVMEFSLHMGPHANFNAMIGKVIQLGELLDTHGVMVFESKAGASPVYIDFMPSAVASLFRGVERGTQRLLSQFMDPEGYPVRIERQPYFRLPRVNGSTQGVTMNPGAGASGRMVRISNPGNVPALALVDIRPDTSAQMVQARVAVKSRGNLTEYEAIYSKQLENATSAGLAPESTTGGTGVISDTTASGNSVLRTIFGGAGKTFEHYRRWYDVIQPSDPRAIEGRYKLFVAVQLKNAVNLELKYGFVADATQPAEMSNGIKEMVNPNAPGTFPASIYTEVDLGYVTVPIGTTALRLEGWAGDPSDSASATTDASAPIRWDYYRLEPADEQVSILSSPGFRSGGVASRTWKPRDMTLVNHLGTSTNDGTTPGSGNQGDIFVVNDSGETAFTKPSTGVALPAGRYEVNIKGAVKDLNNVTEKVGEFRIETDSGGATWSTVTDAQRDLNGRGNAKFTDFDVTLSFTADAAFKYRYVVAQTASHGGAGEREIRLRQVTHSFIRTVKGQDRFVIDGFLGRKEIRNASGQRIWNLNLQGPYIEIPPGEVAIMIAGYEVPPTNYDAIDITEPLAKVDSKNRIYNTRIDIIPRRMGV